MAIALTTLFQPIQAQEPAPSTWNSFINSAENPIVSDTFRMQTFKGEKTDNWEYELSGNTEITDKPELKLSLGSKISFAPYSLSYYSDVSIGVHIASFHLMINENLTFEFFRQGKTEKPNAVKPNTDDVSFDYILKTIPNSPSKLSIQASQAAANTKGGYFTTDSVFAYGNIRQYSLFTGSGNWEDSISWSHNPPLRNRKALIEGNITTHDDINCRITAINNGSLHISSNTQFSTRDLYLYNTESLLSSEGDLSVTNQIILHKTFEEKGKWYFISFPFDIYANNIDTRFQQKDATPNNGGNFFYVQTYNGEKRAQNNLAFGNWEVLPIPSGNTPVFEKNKGYLIALDEKADDQTLTFSSQPGDIPSSFARNGCISISISPSIENTNKENYGWYLCGNPLPCPLPVSQIKDIANLDGNIYLYEKGNYKTYPAQGNFAIPPYTAFFVKASASTEIPVSAEPLSPTTRLLQVSSFSTLSAEEPSVDINPTDMDTGLSQPHFQIKESTLHLLNIEGDGFVEIFNITGNCLLKRPIINGEQITLSHYPKGIYLLYIHTTKNEERKKFMLY